MDKYSTTDSSLYSAEYVNENSDIVYVYPLEELEAGKKMMPMYFKYDTHWNMAGAFVGVVLLLGSKFELVPLPGRAWPFLLGLSALGAVIVFGTAAILKKKNLES